jgi:hypothetical protein
VIVTERNVHPETIRNLTRKNKELTGIRLKDGLTMEVAGTHEVLIAARARLAAHMGDADKKHQ